MQHESCRRESEKGGGWEWNEREIQKAVENMGKIVSMCVAQEGLGQRSVAVPEFDLLRLCQLAGKGTAP